MREYLEKDIHIFSGLKTHAQLTEARSLLMDNGKVRSYESFEQKVTKINEAYNRDYLQAEYQFAVSSAENAANWNNLQDDTDRYWLEYRTAGDERVRAEHRALHGICLPKNDPFWQEYYPPNGWRCRCVAVEVLADDYTLSDSKKSIKKGETATTTIGKSGKNTAEMFRFNPGIEKKVFPSKNTYSKVVGADKVIKDVEKQTKLKNTDDLSNYTESFNNKFPEMFHRGFKKINITMRKDINGNTDMNGTINLKKDIVDNIIGGINNINNKIPTTFDQERAFGTFYHEILHNSNKKGIHYTRPLTPTEVRYMELANEFVARKTLPDFMIKMGGKLNNEILTSDRQNTGYNTMVRNFDRLIQFLDADEKKVLADVKKHLIEEDYKTQQKGLKNAISKNSAYKLKSGTYDSLLKWAKDYSEEDFNTLLEHNKKVLETKKKSK